MNIITYLIRLSALLTLLFLQAQAWSLVPQVQPKLPQTPTDGPILGQGLNAILLESSVEGKPGMEVDLKAPPEKTYINERIDVVEDQSGKKEAVPDPPTGLPSNLENFQLPLNTEPSSTPAPTGGSNIMASDKAPLVDFICLNGKRLVIVNATHVYCPNSAMLVSASKWMVGLTSIVVAFFVSNRRVY